MNTVLENYSPEEKAQLLAIARRTLEAVASGQSRPRVDLESLPSRLHEQRACFVTLNRDHDLRGCTGTLVARRSLAEEVSFTTAQTALNDPRFTPVTAGEVPEINIEISVLTPPMPLNYDRPDDLPKLLRPGVDGVLLQLGPYRSTFLPQVWERIPDPENFLGMLCRKAGLPSDAWRNPRLEVEIYQVVSFEEPAHDTASA